MQRTCMYKTQRELWGWGGGSKQLLSAPGKDRVEPLVFGN